MLYIFRFRVIFYYNNNLFYLRKIMRYKFSDNINILIFNLILKDLFKINQSES